VRPACLRYRKPRTLPIPGTGKIKDVESAHATDHAAHPRGDEVLKRGLIENLDALDRAGKLAVLDYFRRLKNQVAYTRLCLVSSALHISSPTSPLGKDAW
jgi:hypothetical protein